jgi:hydrogenase nickel incorporation protein HypA/HybF
MHEADITQGILDIAFKAAEDAGATKINEVVLTIGTLSQIVPDSIEFYFEILTKDTIADGVKLTINMIPAMAKCRACGNEFNADDMVMKCPKCGDFFSELIAGRELAVDYIDID